MTKILTYHDESVRDPHFLNLRKFYKHNLRIRNVNTGVRLGVNYGNEYTFSTREKKSLMKKIPLPLFIQMKPA